VDAIPAGDARLVRQTGKVFLRQDDAVAGAEAVGVTSLVNGNELGPGRHRSLPGQHILIAGRKDHLGACLLPPTSRRRVEEGRGR